MDCEDIAISESCQLIQDDSNIQSSLDHEYRDAILQLPAVHVDTNAFTTNSTPTGSPCSYRHVNSSLISYYGSDNSDTSICELNQLPKLPFTPYDNFPPLTADRSTQDSIYLNPREQQIVRLLQNQTAVVKTVKNSEWSTFLHKFVTEKSFRTSTSLLPPNGQKMRCFGSTKEYTVGVVFALPKVGSSSDAAYANDQEEQDEIERTNTWCWPSGYAAKTEFNVDKYERLTNGRREALVTIKKIRVNNHIYLRDSDYEIGGRLIVGGLSAVPYNEVFLRVGRNDVLLDDGDESELRQQMTQWNCSYKDGVGFPLALFVRTAQYGDLVTLLRIRARMISVLGGMHEYNPSNIPLLFITTENGVKVITHEMQLELYKILAQRFHPFRNPVLHRTELDNTTADHLRQKIEELLNLNQEDIQSVLTRKECAVIAGGLGVTDESIIRVFMEALQEDQRELQEVVSSALLAAVRAGDYHTSRQILILYTLVATHGQREMQHFVAEKKEGIEKCATSLLNRFLTSWKNALSMYNRGDVSDVSERSSQSSRSGNSVVLSESSSSLCSPCTMLLDSSFHIAITVEKDNNHPPPGTNRPPPLDTGLLRSATNSDGLLVVLGATHILASIYDGGVKQRATEAIEALDEWVEIGENNVAFRLLSWNAELSAQADLKNTVEHLTKFTYFFGKQAIENRKKFTSLLRNAVSVLDFYDIFFLRAVRDTLGQMNCPCLRLELLQYILGLDERYSVTLLSHSVELAAICLSISMYTFSMHQNEPLKIALPYEEAISKMQFAFGDLWSKESLDFVLWHFEGLMENAINSILNHGINGPVALIQNLTPCSGKVFEEDYAMRRKTLGTPTILPPDFLRIPGYPVPSTYGTYEQYTRLLQYEMPHNEISNSSDQTNILDSAAGNLRLQGPKIIEKLSGKYVFVCIYLKKILQTTSFKAFYLHFLYVFTQYYLTLSDGFSSKKPSYTPFDWSPRFNFIH